MQILTSHKVANQTIIVILDEPLLLMLAIFQYSIGNISHLLVSMRPSQQCTLTCRMTTTTPGHISTCLWRMPGVCSSVKILNLVTVNLQTII